MSPENKNLQLPLNNCKHETKNIFQIKSNIKVCFGCSSILYITESGKTIFPVKPEKFNVSQESSTPIFFRFMILIVLIDFIIKKVTYKLGDRL